jgi:hydroxymethylpyrimidine pyrophosphatase-like HAD family hydrolase
MRYHVLACDYDGTIAHHGKVDPDTVAALAAVKKSGRRLVLVTGRQLEDLKQAFPELDLFDAVVAENGALLYEPANRREKPLAGAPNETLVRILGERGVVPLSAGKVIIATWTPHEHLVLETIRELGLELQVIFNKGAVMVLPASVNKASGLKAALAELGLSTRDTVAIGDAENDHSLLREAEYGVAVANAVPMLQREADRTSEFAAGDAVIELVDELIAGDLARAPSRRR